MSGSDFRSRTEEQQWTWWSRKDWTQSAVPPRGLCKRWECCSSGESGRSEIIFLSFFFFLLSPELCCGEHYKAGPNPISTQQIQKLDFLSQIECLRKHDASCLLWWEEGTVFVFFNMRLAWSEAAAERPSCKKLDNTFEPCRKPWHVIRRMQRYKRVNPLQ